MTVRFWALNFVGGARVSDELKHHGPQVVVRLPEAIKPAFRFPVTAQIGAEGLDDFFQAGTDDATRAIMAVTQRGIA